ncbi:hypothetical protein GGS20DRAFT_570733 [Poronia punctata]|nr:hypothetical protein GGS20DRAFT_570733 [Poronia punctata]
MAANGIFADRVPPFPKFYNYLIGAIFVLSLAVLALSAYSQSLSGHYFYDSDVSAFVLFASAWSLLVYGGGLALGLFAPRFYYRFGLLVGQVLGTIFWLTGWAWAASWASYILSFDNYDKYDDVRGAWAMYGDVMGACAGVGALIWILCIIALVVFCWSCSRTPDSADSTPGSNVELANASKPSEDTNQMLSPPTHEHARWHFHGREALLTPQVSAESPGGTRLL